MERRLSVADMMRGAVRTAGLTLAWASGLAITLLGLSAISLGLAELLVRAS